MWEVLTCCSEGRDGSCPGGGLCGKPIETGVWFTNVTTKVTMARANWKVGIASLIDGFGGFGDKMGGDNENAFGCLGVVAILGAIACELFKERAQA